MSPQQQKHRQRSCLQDKRGLQGLLWLPCPEVWSVCCCSLALQKRHIGGTALVTGYPWGKFNTIVDVAGGVGTFTADLLAAHPSLKGIVLDQSQQIERGKQVWGLGHQHGL